MKVFTSRRACRANRAQPLAGIHQLTASYVGVLHMRVVGGEDFGITAAADLVADKDFTLPGIHLCGCGPGNLSGHRHHHPPRCHRGSLSW